nr:hypothetical protein [Tanacetum cinerariifolium]
PSSEESSTQVVILNHVHSINQPPKHINKWTKDHSIDNVIGDPSRPVSTQKQLQDEALFRYFNDFISSVESKSYEDCVMVITLEWIYKVKLDELGADTPMVEKSKLDENPQGKAVDPTRYCGMIGTLMYLITSRPDLVFAGCMYARYQKKSNAISSTQAEYISLSGCCAKLLWVRTQLTDYGLVFNKIP